MLLSHGRGIGPQDALKGESRGFSRVAAGIPGFPRLVTVTSGNFSWCLWEVRNTVELGEGPLGTPLGLVQWKSASSRVDVGTSGFLSCINVSLGVCMLFQTGSQVLTCVEAWNLISSGVVKGIRPPGELNLGLVALFGLATGASELPSCCELILG